jgi:uncharacterized protein YbaP (TraB family)
MLVRASRKAAPRAAARYHALRFDREIGRMASTARVVASLWLLVIGIATCSAADLHCLWAVKGARNTVYLFGSLHWLPPSASTLPPEVLRAYDRAKTLVLEADITDPAIQLGMLQRSMLPAGQTLASVLGPDVYARYTAAAKPLGFEPDSVSPFQPWFAVMMLEMAQLANLGLQADSGVEMQLATRAATDGKRVEGLETVAQHLALLSDMSMPEQRDFVAGSLEDLAGVPKMLDRLVDAWIRGDTKAIEESSVDAFRRYPALQRRLVTDRNRRWVDKLARMLEQGDDYFVAVGVLHLVGRDSVVDLLRRRGYTVVQR